MFELERGKKLLGKHAVARTLPGEWHGEGEVIAYCEGPQVCIRQMDGSHLWWRAGMCTFTERETDDELLARLLGVS